MPTISSVYIIYSADVVSESPDDIDSMSPARHMSKTPEIGAKFVQTEDDEQYDYGYLGDESGDIRYYPFGYLDAESLNEYEGDDDETPRGLGQHRKWIGELTSAEWQTFADAYIIDLDPDTGLPVTYQETLGSITKYGHLPAIAIDNREGWEHGSFGYGPVLGVIDSQFYISFAFKE